MKTLNQKYQHEIEVERLWLTSKQGEYIFFSILPMSLVLVFVLWDRASHQLLLSWFYILTGINFFRWVSSRFFYIHKSALIADVQRYKRILLIGCSLAGVWVGLGNVWFLDPTNTITMMGLCIFTIVVGVGAVFSWFSYLPAVAAIVLPAAGSMAVLLLTQGDRTSMAFGIMFLIMAAIGIVGSQKLARMLSHALLLNFENVALRKETEEKSLLLETALENMAQGISMSDKDDHLRMWNRQFVNLLGIAGKHVSANAYLSAILSTANPPMNVEADGKTKYRLPDGQVYIIRQNTLAQGGRLLTYTDVTELYNREQALEKASKEAVRANAAKTRFLAAASHDLRQPIHALGLFFAELSDRVRSPETEHVIGQVEDSIDAINSMLNALLDVSKLDAEVVKPSVQAVNLQGLFDRLQIEFQPIALENHNRLHIRPALVTVMSDPLMLERMLRNLIGNALRYTENGRVLVVARKRKQRVEIQIIDNGIGIPKDQLDEIFVEFHQLQNPARDRRRGLGLGLAIVKRLGKLLDHPVKVASQFSRGSCFSITLPLANEQETNKSVSQVETAYAPSNSLQGRRILVLDDDISVLEGMHGLLSHWGCQVISAGSPAEAVDKVVASIQKPEVLIIDYRLADNVSGIDVAVNLQKRFGYPIAVLIITGDTGPERLQEAEASGFPLLHKPVQPAKLRSTLQFLISKIRLQIN